MLIVLLIAWLLTASAPADAQMLVQVSPTQYDVTVREDAPVRRPLFVDNLSRQAVTVRLRVADLTMGPRGELGLLRAGSTAASLSGLIHIEPASLTIEPGRRGLVHLTVRLPSNGPPTRYGVVLSEIRPGREENSAAAAEPMTELATRMFFTRVAPESTSVELTRLEARSTRAGGLTVTLRLLNRGQRHAPCLGEATVVDSTGAEVERLALGQGIVLPGASRVFSCHSRVRLAPGRYRVIASLDARQRELLVGEASVRIPKRNGEPTASDPGD